LVVTLLAALLTHWSCIMAFTLSSSAFIHGGAIPSKHTCQGLDLSPALAWEDPPAGTVTYVLIVDDPDAPDPAAPRMTWVHWVLLNLPAATRTLPEGAHAHALPGGTVVGSNDWRKRAWGGPCPPVGNHRYFFKLYALDVALALSPVATKADVEAAMVGHIQGQATLMGTYNKHAH